MSFMIPADDECIRAQLGIGHDQPLPQNIQDRYEHLLAFVHRGGGAQANGPLGAVGCGCLLVMLGYTPPVKRQVDGLEVDWPQIASKTPVAVRKKDEDGNEIWLEAEFQHVIEAGQLAVKYPNDPVVQEAGQRDVVLKSQVPEGVNVDSFDRDYNDKHEQAMKERFATGDSRELAPTADEMAAPAGNMQMVPVGAVAGDEPEPF